MDEVVGGPAATSRLGGGPEFDLIRRFLRDRGERGGTAAGGAHVLVGPGDDCTVVAGAGIALSTDLSIEGIHFRREWCTPEEIGWRAAAAALSDLAAVAAEPIGILVSLAVPSHAPEEAVRIMDGARSAAAEFGAALLGGDLSVSPGPVLIDAIVVGNVERPVLRSGARSGDALWVSGVLGGAGAAVAAWLRGENPSPEAREAFLRPRPRIAEARWLAERGVPHAMIDLSDGLGGDAAHIAAASAVALTIEVDHLPLHPASLAAGTAEGVELGLSGGEDYELCFAAEIGAVEGVLDEFAARFRLRLTRVGEASEGAGVSLRLRDGTLTEITAAGFQHFGGGQK